MHASKYVLLRVPSTFSVNSPKLGHGISLCCEKLKPKLSTSSKSSIKPEQFAINYKNDFED